MPKKKKLADSGRICYYNILREKGICLFPRMQPVPERTVYPVTESEDDFMRKMISLVLTVCLAAGLAACAAQPGGTAGSETEAPAGTAAAASAEAAAETEPSKAAPEETAEKTEAAETAAETPAAGLPNPMVEITDEAEFLKQLGIDIDTSKLPDGTKLFIIDRKVADCRFTFAGASGKPVECCLRATKDSGLAQDLHGIFDSTLKDISDFDYTGSSGVFTITLTVNDAEDTAIYTWKSEDTWYSFSLQGETDGAEVAEALDCAITAAMGEVRCVGAAEEEECWYELSADGTVLTVRLRGNATTGYMWSYKIFDDGTLEEITSEYVEDAHEAGLAGAGGVWVCSWRVPKDFEGRNYITFTYSRSWEGEGIPSRALDIAVSGRTMEVLTVHEPDLTLPAADDGEYEVVMSYQDLLEQNELSFYGLVTIPETVTFTDEEIRMLKPGDVIELTQYGLYDVMVDRFIERSETSIEINDVDRLDYDAELGAWIIRGPDDDIFRYEKEKRTVHFTNESRIEDGMEEILKTGNSGTIYDKMKAYKNVTAKITVKDGWVSDIRIYYHP